MRWLLVGTVLLLAACTEILPDPPLLDEMEPAVRDQYHELRNAVERSKGDREPHGRAYGALGTWYHAYRLTDGAEACYRKARHLDPENADWPYYLAMLVSVSGRTEEALELYRLVLAMAPDDSAARIRLAELELRHGRTEDSERLLEQALALDSRSARALVGLADLAIKEGRAEAAITYLHEALELQSQGRSPILHALGLAYRAIGDLAMADRYLGLAQSASGDWESLRMYDPRGVALWARDIGSMTALGRARRAARAGNRREALRRFEQALRADPESVGARLGKARILLGLGRLSEAETLLLEILSKEPDQAAAHYALALLRKREGDLERARSELEQALVLDPKLLGAQVELAHLLVDTGQLRDALLPLAAARQLQPEKVAIWTEEAEVLIRLGETERARDLLDVASALRDRRLTLLRARLLATAPEKEIRDGQRSLEIAWREFRARPALDAGEVVALALAELGDRRSAVACQEILERAALAVGRTEILPGLRSRLGGITKGEPVRLSSELAMETMDAIYISPELMSELVAPHLAAGLL